MLHRLHIAQHNAPSTKDRHEVIDYKALIFFSERFQPRKKQIYDPSNIHQPSSDTSCICRLSGTRRLSLTFTLGNARLVLDRSSFHDWRLLARVFLSNSVLCIGIRAFHIRVVRSNLIWCSINRSLVLHVPIRIKYPRSCLISCLLSYVRLLMSMDW